MVPGHNRTWANYSECLKFMTNETRERVRASSLPSLTLKTTPAPLVNLNLADSPSLSLSCNLNLFPHFALGAHAESQFSVSHLRRRYLTA